MPSSPTTASAPESRDTPSDTRPALRVVYARPDAPDRSWQPALPLEWRLPSDLPAVPVPPRHLKVVGNHTPSPAGGLPHPGPWVARLAPAIFEVIAGERPVAQLTRWTSRDILATLARRHAAARRHPAGRDRAPLRRTTRTVRLHSVRADIVEVSAVVATSERCRAIALRLEIVGRESASGLRWLVTACEIG